MTPPVVCLASIGCKLNAHEVEMLAFVLRKSGFVVTHSTKEAFDFFILNSCTVTGRSDARARNLLRSAKHRNPESVVIVTGCSAQNMWRNLEKIPEIDYIRGNLEKENIPILVRSILSGERPPRTIVPAFTSPAPLQVPLLTEFRSLARPFIKIQDGCDNACAYCAIPAARGPQRSSPPERVLEQVSVFCGGGYSEIVLSGVHLGAYGSDLRPASTLVGLLERITALPGCPRLRISSLEPLELTEELVAFLVRHMNLGTVCRHLHIPLQSGDDSILRLMNRRYDSRHYARVIEKLVSSVGGVCIGADVLVGFPGETDDNFAQTLSLVERLPLAYLHVFGYSKRPGTPAATWPDQVAPEKKKERCAILRELSLRKRRTFLESMLGHRLDCVVVQPSRSISGATELLSDNYVKVIVPKTGMRQGGLVSASVIGVKDTYTDGTLSPGRR